MEKVPEEIRKWYSELGKRSGEKNKLKGSAYFSKIGKKAAAKRWGPKQGKGIRRREKNP